MKFEACRAFNIFFSTNNTEARMKDSIFHMTLQ